MSSNAIKSVNSALIRSSGSVSPINTNSRPSIKFLRICLAYTLTTAEAALADARIRSSLTLRILSTERAPTTWTPTSRPRSMTWWRLTRPALMMSTVSIIRQLSSHPAVHEELVLPMHLCISRASK
jgi:hypothetical protein